MQDFNKLLSLCLILLLEVGVGAESKQDFSLTNKSDQDIACLYLCPSGSNIWRGDLLGEKYMEPKSEVLIRFDEREKASYWNFLFILKDGTVKKLYNINIYDHKELFFKFNKEKNEATIEWYD